MSTTNILDLNNRVNELAESYPANKVMMSDGVTSVERAIVELGSIKPEGFITFKEKMISEIPVIIPVYHTESNYAFITVTTSNFNTHTGIFCIRLNKSDGSFLVYAKINNDDWTSFSNYEANWLAL